MYARPTAPRSIGGVVDDGFRLGRQAFPKTFPLAFAAQALVAIPLLIFKFRYGSVAQLQQMAAIVASPGLSAFYGAAALVSVGFNNAIVARTISVAQNAEMSVGESLSVGFRLLPRAILTGLLFALGFILIGVCFLIPGIFLAAQWRVLLALLFFLPIVFYVGRLFLASIIFVAEDTSAAASIMRSWLLTKSHWWRTATILSVVLIMVIVLLLLVGLAAGLLGMFIGIASSTAVWMIQLVSSAGNAVFAPFVTAALLAIYYDLKLRRDGGDLAGRVDALSAR